MSNTSQEQQQPRSKRLREKLAAEEEEEAEAANPSVKRPRESEPRPRWKAHQMAQDYVDLASHMMLHPLSNLGPYGYAVAGERAAGCNGTTTSTASTSDGVTSTPVDQQPQQQYPMQHLSALSYLKSPVRRPTVLETWSPYEIALFEAAIAEYGKEFYRIAKEIGGTKTTKDVIEFYYIWKKTSHYQQWKKEYVPDYLLEHWEDDEDE